MKEIRCYFFALIVILTGCSTGALDCPGCTGYIHDGEDRGYLLHAPEQHTGEMPLLLVLHGYKFNALSMKTLLRLDDIADKEGFIVCYPQGLRDQRGETHWNANFSTGKVDDVGFLSSLTEYLLQAYDIDTSKVFVAGISNGGFMGYSLIRERPDLFKGVASIIGGMSAVDWEARNQYLPCPVLQLSGQEDRVVPISGTVPNNLGWDGSPAIPLVVDFWQSINRATDSVKLNIGANVKGIHYEGGINKVWYYEVEGMGHHIPLDVLYDIDAGELIWSFFDS